MDRISAGEVITVAEKAIAAVCVWFDDNYSRVPTPEELEQISNEFESRLYGYVWYVEQRVIK